MVNPGFGKWQSRWNLIILFCLFFLGPRAEATCTNSEKGVPGQKGEIQYNLVSDELQYCDFNNWRPLKYDESRSNFVTVYNQDFQAGATADEWGPAITKSLTRFLGRIGTTGNQQGPNYTFSLPGTQATTLIEFDLYEIDRWNSEEFMVYINDVEIIRVTLNESLFDVLPGGAFAGGTWSVTYPIPISFDMGFNLDLDQLHHFSIELNNPADTTVKIGFGSRFTDFTVNNSFGIDNLQIREVTGGTPTLVVDEDFEAGVTPGSWGGSYNVGLSSFLGRSNIGYGRQTISKSFSLSGGQDQTRVTLDFYEIDSWDGEMVEFYMDDVLVYTVSLTTAYNTPPSGSSGPLSWTVQNLLTQNFNIGFAQWDEQAYRYTFTYTNPGATTFKLGFGSRFDEARTNEAFGIDNIVIEEIESGVPTATIYTEDFEAPLPPGDWGAAVTVQFGSFLGRIGGTGGAQGPNKTFTLPGSQDTTTLTFDFYELDSWDNESFRVFINDVQVLSHSFRNITYDQPASGSLGNVSWTVAQLTPFQDDFGFSGKVFPVALSGYDQLHRYALTITNPGATNLKVGFGSTTDEALVSESFGIDNIELVTVTGGVPSTLYQDNFDDGNADRRWQATPHEATAFTRVLGLFAGSGGAQAVSKTYPLSGSQDSTTIVFDAWEVDSWDDESFFVFVNDTQVFSEVWRHNTTQTPSSGTLGSVTWTGVSIKPSLTHYGGQFPANVYGSEDQAYRYTLTINNPGATSVKIGFGSNANGLASDEAYGIDNVAVSEVVSGVPSEVFFEDFESGATGWSNNSTYQNSGPVYTVNPSQVDNLPGENVLFTIAEESAISRTFLRTRTETNGSFTQFLGRFIGTGGAQGPFKDFALPGTQDRTLLQFDFYEIDTWDSENFIVYVNNLPVITVTANMTTFEKPRQGVVGNVSWRALNITETNSNIGYGIWNDQIIRFFVTLDNPGATNVRLGFGNRLDDPGAEEMGLDNIQVSHFNVAPVASHGACASQGQMSWNSVSGGLEWCDGANLWFMGQPASGSGGCTTPTAVAGALNFDPALKIYLFCDGNGWVRVDN